MEVAAGRQGTGELRAEVAAKHASQEAESDQDADTIRLGAPDIVPVMHGDAVTA